MARHSQGLQVLLIVFVMLTVLLGVTTYLNVKKADEKDKALQVANSAKTQAEQATAEKQKELEDLKARMVGATDKSTDEVKKQFADDAQVYAGAKQADSEPAAGAAADKPADAGTPYSRMIASMAATIQARNDALIRARAEAVDYAEKFKNREAASANQVAKFDEGVKTLNQQILTVVKDYHGTQEASALVEAQNVKTVTTAKQYAAAKASAADDAVKNAALAVQKKEEEVRATTKILNDLRTNKIDIPHSGEVSWVSLPNKMVWINRGRADNLQRQTQFTVFAGDSVSAAKGATKGKVEVTRITGEHEAEARIVEDKLTDPIMAGDKVFTPFWSPGQQNHFALAGIMNLDGDGRNQVGAVRGMIKESGGEVDCELDEQGRKQGQITPDTRFIVVGDLPDKASPDTMKNNGVILEEAKRYNVQVMKLSDLKQQMGYQKSSSVEHFGASGASSSELNQKANALKAAKPATPKADAPSDSGGQ
jgi:hypothetical protein